MQHGIVTVTPGTTAVGFIGLGIMGRSMAVHIQAAGYPLHVFTRTRDKAAPVLAAGATWHDDPAALAAACDVIVTMVGYPADVEAVYFGPEGAPEQGILANLKPGAVAIDMTTSSPSLAERIAEAARTRGAYALDAPVSGGDVGAQNATLAIMVGGDAAAFDAVRPLFEQMGKGIARLGPAGAGQHTKMVNQTVIASTILGVAEGLAYGKAAGLDLDQVLEVIGGGAAGGFQLNVLGKRMAEGDFAPGFYVHHFIKDMGIAGAEAERMALDLESLTLARTLFERFAAEGGREDGTQGIYKMIAAK
ncbi:NAD(P)-dependent oxidoreductase [Roseospira marina]|uniref:NAD(P)-dependent oxidoreductase n=1 Tax=Roseospira marina TaxID=140057 RepID=A0A5M6I7M9_9PROT|nr:NAD(P)-dependent oxidoreductase [Roseospira marina]KAA5604153.1 NAD(P)-dependent oxidoreductase [Roseospira marina]MBB4315750.1 3-hydroxyisobutyrate dehydrogenase [Roseospira marina]MBB5088917.1 3-hydroxyisobutyrate dehydrogenase [Roseospira marina]